MTKGPAPTAQSSACVVYHKKLLVFGGIINGKAQNSVHILDISRCLLLNCASQSNHVFNLQVH